MKINLTKWAAAGVLTLTATAAFAGSVTQPGETVGVAAGAPLPPGFYFVDTTSWGTRDQSGGPSVGTGVTIPVIAWSTPWKIFGARVQFLVATPLVATGVEGGGPFNEGWYNPFFAGQLAWDLGGGFGFSYALGTYIGVNTPVAASSESSLNQRFALSYTGNGWDVTGNLIWGSFFDHDPINGGNDFLNLDLTATKKIGKWEVGAVGFYSTDLGDVIHKQSQFALGGLVGYNFGPVILQSYLTRDVSQENHGGFETRVWSRIIVPLGDPLAPTPSGMIYKK